MKPKSFLDVVMTNEIPKEFHDFIQENCESRYGSGSYSDYLQGCEHLARELAPAIKNYTRWIHGLPPAGSP